MWTLILVTLVVSGASTGGVGTTTSFLDFPDEANVEPPRAPSRLEPIRLRLAWDRALTLHRRSTALLLDALRADARKAEDAPLGGATSCNGNGVARAGGDEGAGVAELEDAEAATKRLRHRVPEGCVLGYEWQSLTLRRPSRVTRDCPSSEILRQEAA